MSPSKAAAVYGVSRWESARSLWHRMRGELPPEDPKDIFAVGHAYEPTIRELWKLDNPGWRLSHGEVQVNAGDRFGFPLVATVDGRASKGRARKVVEKKTARKLEEWGDDFTEAGAPMDYVVQVWVQQLVTGWTKEPADLTVMGPYFKHHTYRIAFDADVATDIADELGKFYRRLKDPDAAPELDDHVATYECIRAMHPDIDDTRRVTLDTDLGLEYLDAVLEFRDVEKRLRGLKTRVLDAMGDAKHADIVTGEGADGPVLERVAYRKPGRGGAVSLNPISEKAMEALV
ncbi:YqaJ viral recombinase family protein [Rhodococcus sp. NPDC019609]